MTRIEQFVSYFHNESINFNWQKCLFPSFLRFATFFQQSEDFSSIIINDKENSKSYILPVNQQLIILVEKLK